MIAPGIVSLPLFMLVVFLLNTTPGLDTAYIAGRSVSQGRAAGLLLSLRVSAGCCAHVLAVALGLTALLAASTVAFTAIKVVGVTYPIYLGGRMLLVLPERDDATVEQVETPAAKYARPLKSLFMQGLLINVSNLRVVLFFLSFFSQFVDPLVAYKTLAFLALGVMLIAMLTIWNSLVAWAAVSIARRTARKSGIKCWFDRVVGTAFIGLGARLVFTIR